MLESPGFTSQEFSLTSAEDGLVCDMIKNLLCSVFKFGDFFFFFFGSSDCKVFFHFQSDFISAVVLNLAPGLV